MSPPMMIFLVIFFIFVVYSFSVVSKKSFVSTVDPVGAYVFIIAMFLQNVDLFFFSLLFFIVYRVSILPLSPLIEVKNDAMSL